MSNTGILNANLRVLKARFPSVYQRLIGAGSQPTKYFEYTGNGESLKLISKGSGQPYAVYGEGQRGNFLIDGGTRIGQNPLCYIWFRRWIPCAIFFGSLSRDLFFVKRIRLYSEKPFPDLIIQLY